MPARIGVYVDGPYGLTRSGAGDRVAPDLADAPFLSFATAVGRWFDEQLLFGRLERPGADDGLTLPADVGFVPLPPYPRSRRPGALVRAVLGTCRAFWRGVGRVDVVWVFGPHPYAFLLTVLALARRRRVVLGVRQDTIGYFGGRLRRGRGVMPAVRALDAGFRVAARVVPVTVVGPAIERHYGGPRPGVLNMTVSLMRAADVAAEPPARREGPVHLVTVGRIDREKNPLLLVEALAELERLRPGGYRLSWAGVGPMTEAVRQRAEQLGVAPRLQLLGFVPFGARLVELYRSADVFVHVSLTEGVPAVLVEALAAGAPVVATDVGGVASAIDGGRAGLLVPPDDLGALVSAILRMEQDAELRERSVRRGIELAREATLEVQAERVARFLRGDG